MVCKRRKAAAACLMGVFMVSVSAGNVMAAPAQNALAGFSVSLENAYETQHEDVVNTKVMNEVARESAFEGKCFSIADDYAEMHSEPSEDSQVVGKYYKGAIGSLEDISGEYYLVKSGTVTGYVHKQYLATEDYAVQLSSMLGSNLTMVTGDTLYVRQEADVDSGIVASLDYGEEIVVENTAGEWAKVNVDGVSGYVNKDYIDTTHLYRVAESPEEEAARIALEEEKARLAEEEARRQAEEEAAAEASYIGQQMADYGQQFIGNPYVWGGTSLTNGADCSGFVQSIYKHFGYSIPRTSREQAAGGTEISISELRPGDLIFYATGGRIDHVTMYIGNGQVVQASSPSTGIKVSSYDYRTPVKAVRYI